MPPVSPLTRMRIPIWREARLPLERVALRRDPVLRGEGVPHGDGAPIVLVPGFLAGDLSLGTMARWLRDLGYRPCRAEISANVDCTERALERLSAVLARRADAAGRPVTIVGHSRGGVMARILAVRHPELVSGIACLGAPLLDQYAVHPLVTGQIKTVAALGSLGVPGLFSYRCESGCCEEAHRQMREPVPDGIGFVSIFSRSDGVVDWRSCLDTGASQTIEVRASHCGMAVHPHVFRELGRLLPQLTGAAPAGAARTRRRLAAAA